MEYSQVPNYVMSTLCRICAEKSTKLTPIFESESLFIKVNKCLPIQVKQSDYLPLNICEGCFLKVNESYSLYLKADEADQRLRKLWKILLKETTAGYLVIPSPKEKAATEFNNSQNIEGQPNEVKDKISLFNYLGSNFKESAHHSVDILGNNCQQTGEDSGEVTFMSRSISFEVVNKGLILKSPNENTEPSEVKGSQMKEKHEVEIVMNEQLKETADAYQCQFCPSQLSTLTKLSIHESTHSEERPYLCDSCGKSFKHAKYLKSHSRTHLTVRKKYVCRVCSKGFLTNFFLQEHMNSHTGETPYKCPVCEKEFREKVHLRQHKWIHSNQKFVCPICGSKFNRKGNMTAHMKQYHKNGAAAKLKTARRKSELSPNENGNFMCTVCSCQFPTQGLLKTHLKTHPEQKRFACSVCGKKFRHSGSLTYHRRSAHTGERPFQCNYCDEKFSLKSVRIIHERKTHTFEYPYKCTFCSRPFTNSSSLKNHLYVHSKEKMFKCDECGKSFSRNSSLFMHKKLHLNDRKFACDQCEKSFIQKHDLLKHGKVHDPKSKPFFCKYCGNSFSHKKDSAKHAMCQYDFMKKNSPEFYSAEKMLDSVTNSLEKSDRDFSVEEEQQLILNSVQQYSGEEANIIYADKGSLTSEVSERENFS